MKDSNNYTDGACSGQPRPGRMGRGADVRRTPQGDRGGDAHTTNNRMELTGPIEALELLKQPCKVRLYSDSAYLVNAFNQHWIANWQRNGWQTSQKKPVENKELWGKAAGAVPHTSR